MDNQHSTPQKKKSRRILPTPSPHGGSPSTAGTGSNNKKRKKRYVNDDVSIIRLTNRLCLKKMDQLFGTGQRSIVSKKWMNYLVQGRVQLYRTNE